MRKLEKCPDQLEGYDVKKIKICLSQNMKFDILVAWVIASFVAFKEFHKFFYVFGM